MNVQFECQFDKIQQVHLNDPIAANLFQVTLDNGEVFAEFEVSFGIYEDETFRNAFEFIIIFLMNLHKGLRFSKCI